MEIKDPLAAEMVGWRKECKSTIRNSYQILNRGTPNLENDLWNISAQVINGALTPEAAGKQAQADVDKCRSRRTLTIGRGPRFGWRARHFHASVIASERSNP